MKNGKRTKAIAFVLFRFFINIFNCYFLPFLAYLEDAESNGIGLALCNPWESG